MDRASSRSPPPSSPPRRTTFTRPVEEVPTKYRTLLEQPGLDTFDQIMVEHLGMEELYKLYTDENRDVFNQPTTLRLLAQRFKLEAEEGEIKTFVDLLRLYDQKYATVRTYNLPGHSPEDILLQACREGNIQAVIKGLKLYPELRTELTYVRCWDEAAYKAQPTIVWFFFDLLAQVPEPSYYSSLSLESAARGGDLEILKHLLALLKEKMDGEAYTTYLNANLEYAFRVALAANQDEMIEELMKEKGFEARIFNTQDRDTLVEHAGMSGQYEKVELVFNLLQIEQDGEVDFYNSILWGAAEQDHLALVEKVASLASAVGRFDALGQAIGHGSSKVAQYLLDSPEWTTQELANLIPELIREHQDELLEDVLERLEGKPYAIPPGTLENEMVYRREESFWLVAWRILARATAKRLNILRSQAVVYDNKVLATVISNLLRLEVHAK